MRICPKCNYVDPPEWRHSRFSYWIDFCIMDDFKVLEPKLAEKLLKGEKIVEDDLYLYRATKGFKQVHRKAKIDYGYQWQIPMEHHTLHPVNQITDYRRYWQLTHPSQKKLVEDNR